MSIKNIEYRTNGKVIIYGHHTWQLAGTLAHAETEMDAKRIVTELNLIQKQLESYHDPK